MRKTKKLFQFYAVTEREREDEYKEELRKFFFFFGKRNMSNAADTNYFTIFLQTVVVAYVIFK